MKETPKDINKSSPIDDTSKVVDIKSTPNVIESLKVFADGLKVTKKQLLVFYNKKLNNVLFDKSTNGPVCSTNPKVMQNILKHIAMDDPNAPKDIDIVTLQSAITKMMLR